MTKENVKSAILELLRVVVLAIIPILIDSLNKGEIDLRLIGITGVIAGLKFIDKLMHNVGKDADNGLITGLTRF